MCRQTGLLCVVLILLGGFKESLYAQTDSSHKLLPDITVTTFRNESVNRSSLNIVVLNVDSMKFQGNFNITDLMAKSPGMSMLSTGVAIAKPVIRGSGGNRVLILLNGLKFDNQQWQEEHGLGIGDMGIGRVEIVKGPMSVLFGSEATGGVVNLIDESKPEAGNRISDILVKGNSNTLGGSLQLGYLVNTGKRWFRLRAGMENNADYSDGYGHRVLNSRFDGYCLKATYGFTRKRWESTNNYSSSFNRFGFIFNDVYTFITADDRWSRRLNVNPNHMVLLNILSSQNRMRLKDNSILNLNVGFQSNERMENEGGGQISLNMHLMTLQYLAKWEKELNDKHGITISSLTALEDNTNYGGRKIIPDARMQESNLAAYLESRISDKFVWENGLAGGFKRIHSFFTAGVNSPEKLIHPFVKSNPYYNGFTGISFHTRNGWNSKLNVSSGVRMPNLAELSSNGLHEGIFTFEIGNPNFKNEQLLSGNFQLQFENRLVSFSISPFYNLYHNFVYLAPTADKWLGLYPIYLYQQQNATQYGTEFMLIFRAGAGFFAGFTGSGMVSKTADGNYTPYTPARKLTPQVSWVKANNRGSIIRAWLAADLVQSQPQVATGEIGSKAYQLLNAGISTGFDKGKRRFDLSLAANNLLNQAYTDNLSRFKNYGLLNIGRNIAVTLRIRNTGHTK